MTTGIARTVRLPNGAELALRVPSMRDIGPLILLPHLRTPARLAAVRPLFFRKMVAAVDGAPATLAQADAWAADSAATAALLPPLRAYLEAGRVDGVAVAQCPACRAWEAELPIATLADALGSALPPLFEGDYFAIPKLAQPMRAGRRPTAPPPTSRLRAHLPSARLALDAPFRDPVVVEIEPGPPLVPPGTAPVFPGPREQAAWDHWAPNGVSPIAGREHWRHELPAFHAALRLALALEPDGLGDPSLVERMPSIDFWFLDALYWLTHAVDVTEAARAAIGCGLCGASFLPVR